MPFMITGGRIAFSRTIQARQFEPKHSEVEFTFSTPEGQEGLTTDELQQIGDMVKSEAMRLVNSDPEPTVEESNPRRRGRE